MLSCRLCRAPVTALYHTACVGLASQEAERHGVPQKPSPSALPVKHLSCMGIETQVPSMHCSYLFVPDEAAHVGIAAIEVCVKCGND